MSRSNSVGSLSEANTNLLEGLKRRAGEGIPDMLEEEKVPISNSKHVPGLEAIQQRFSSYSGSQKFTENHNVEFENLSSENLSKKGSEGKSIM